MGILQNEAHLEWRFRWGNGWGKWRLNDDLNQQDDKTESAASAQDGGRDVDEYLEPIFNEAEWKKTPKNASPSSSSYISGVSVKHVPNQFKSILQGINGCLYLGNSILHKRPYGWLPVWPANACAATIAFSNLLQWIVDNHALSNTNAAEHNCSARSWLSFKLARRSVCTIRPVYRMAIFFIRRK